MPPTLSTLRCKFIFWIGPEEESDKEKHEKRPRLDNNQKHGEDLRNNDGTSLFEAETPICNEIDDGKLN